MVPNNKISREYQDEFESICIRLDQEIQENDISVFFQIVFAFLTELEKVMFKKKYKTRISNEDYLLILKQMKQIVNQELSRHALRNDFYYKHDQWWWVSVINLALGSFPNLTEKQRNAARKRIIARVLKLTVDTVPS